MTSMDAWEVPRSALDGEVMIANVRTSVGTSTGISGTGPMLPERAGSEIGRRQNDLDENGAPLPGSMSRAAGSADRPSGVGRLAVVAEECLVVSGALDRTLCVFRARFGQGLSLLRRLNVACSPRGLPGALVVGTPVEGASGGIQGAQLEVSTSNRFEWVSW